MASRAARALARVAAFATAISARAVACDCLALAPLSTAVATEADVVFAGRVVEVTERSEHRSTVRPSGAETSVRLLDAWAEFAVSQVWRGVAGPTVRVHVDGSDCAYRFEPGAAYLVFARRRAGMVWGSVCSRTAPLDAASDVVRALGPPGPR